MWTPGPNKTLLPMCTSAGTRITQLKLKNTRRSEEHTSELQSRENLVCRLLRLTPCSAPFPYTTLFRSAAAHPHVVADVHRQGRLEPLAALTGVQRVCGRIDVDTGAKQDVAADVHLGGIEDHAVEVEEHP